MCIRDSVEREYDEIFVQKYGVVMQKYQTEINKIDTEPVSYTHLERIAGYENDAALAEQHKPQGEDKFCPMTLKGVTYTCLLYTSRCV